MLSWWWKGNIYRRDTCHSFGRIEWSLIRRWGKDFSEGDIVLVWIFKYHYMLSFLFLLHSGKSVAGKRRCCRNNFSFILHEIKKCHCWQIDISKIKDFGTNHVVVICFPKTACLGMFYVLFLKKSKSLFKWVTAKTVFLYTAVYQADIIKTP